MWSCLECDSKPAVFESGPYRGYQTDDEDYIPVTGIAKRAAPRGVFAVPIEPARDRMAVPDKGVGSSRHRGSGGRE